MEWKQRLREFWLRTRTKFEFDQGIWVRGAVCICLWLVYNVLCFAMIKLHEHPPFHAVFRGFWVSAQKPPGGDDGAAKRRISSNPNSGFYHELPGSEMESARRYMIYVVVLLCFCEFHDMWIF